MQLIYKIISKNLNETFLSLLVFNLKLQIKFSPHISKRSAPKLPNPKPTHSLSYLAEQRQLLRPSTCKTARPPQDTLRPNRAKGADATETRRSLRSRGPFGVPRPTPPERARTCRERGGGSGSKTHRSFALVRNRFGRVGILTTNVVKEKLLSACGNLPVQLV